MTDNLYKDEADHWLRILTITIMGYDDWEERLEHAVEADRTLAKATVRRWRDALHDKIKRLLGD